MIQADDMGRATSSAVWLEELASQAESAPITVTKKMGGQLRTAAGTIRTLQEEREQFAKEVSEERARLRAEETRIKAMAAELERRPPERRKLPEERQSRVRKFEIGGKLSVYIIPGLYPDGRLGEIFLKCDRQGSLASGALDALAIAVSMGLQYGIPLSVFADKLIGTRFDPSGYTGDPKYPKCASPLDLVFRWLRDEYAPRKDPPPESSESSSPL